MFGINILKTRMMYDYAQNAIKHGLLSFTQENHLESIIFGAKHGLFLRENT